MFRVLFLVLLPLLLGACSNQLHPGFITLPELTRAGDLQVAAHGTLHEAMVGGHAQLAYALSDQWGVLVTAGYGFEHHDLEGRRLNQRGAMEWAVMRMFGKAADQQNSRYYLQAGYTFSHSSMMNDYSPGLNFIQNQFYVQGSSRHYFGPDFSFAAGFRIAASGVHWVWGSSVYPGQPGYESARVREFVREINQQPVFLLLSPVMQLERQIQNCTLLFTLQPTQVMNQTYFLPPITPINLGIRWQIN
ncbi:MAG: hypothetical protein ACK417_12235 [Bacteroidia bacterium]